MIVSSVYLNGGIARAFDDDKEQAEAVKAFEGTWVTEENAGIEAKWVFTGTSVRATVNGMDYGCKMKLEPATKPNSTADFVIEDGPEDAKGKMSKAIYKLEGDKLTLCVSHPGKERPTKFEDVPEEAVLFQLKKQKKS